MTLSQVYHIMGQKTGEGAWESNPPGTPCRAPHWI